MIPGRKPFPVKKPVKSKAREAKTVSKSAKFDYIAPHDARTLLNDEIAFRQFAALSKATPAQTLIHLMRKFPSMPTNRNLLRYLKKN